MIKTKGAVETPLPYTLSRTPIMTAPTIKDFFKHLPAKFDAEAADDLEAVYQFDLSGPHGGQSSLAMESVTCGSSSLPSLT